MQLQIDGVDTLVADFAEYPRKAAGAMVRALNRSISSGRTLIVRLVAKDTGLKSGDVRRAVRLTNATRSRPTASLDTSARRLALSRFKARQTRRGVTYRLPGGRGRVPSGFLTRVSSGHEGVFVRRGRSRLPLRQLFGPSIGGVVAKFRPIGIARVQEAFGKNFDHEMRFESSR